jgi:hypothetical protein
MGGMVGWIKHGLLFLLQDLKVIFEEEKRQVRASLEEQIQLKDKHISELKEKFRKAMEDLIKYKSGGK